MSDKSKTKNRTDCCVIAGGTEFHLDSYKIMQWSGFFRNYFSTNDMTVSLDTISSVTFQLILDMLNSGDTTLLTEDNVNNVWHAAHQLQISVLVKICGDFIVARLTLDNVDLYNRQADKLEALGVIRGITQLLMKKFSALINSEVFLNLSSEDLKHVVESDDLVVESEDVVLNAIYAWVKTNENERKKYLVDILQCTRYCQASKSCIVELMQNSLSLDDSRVQEILNKALAFKVDICYMSGFWPNTAIYRESMRYDHVGVYCTAASKFIQISLKKNEIISSVDIPTFKTTRLAVINGNLVASSDTSELFTLKNKMWLRVCDLRLAAKDKCHFMLSHESSIFVISRKKRLYRFCPNDWDTPCQESTHDIVSPRHAMSFNDKILVFAPVNHGGDEQTTVCAWQSDTKTWNKIGDLGMFSSDKMTSFKDDLNAYILDNNGHLWKLTSSKSAVFTYIGKIWNMKVNLTGALLFRKSLFVFVTRTQTSVSLNLDTCAVSEIFQNVLFHSTGNASNAVNYVHERDVHGS